MTDHMHIAQQSPGQLSIVFIAREDHFNDLRQVRGGWGRDGNGDDRSDSRRRAGQQDAAVGIGAAASGAASRETGDITLSLFMRSFATIRPEQEAADAGFAVEVLAQRQWVDFLRRSSGKQSIKLVK
jgi:hypothetical protein